MKHIIAQIQALDKHFVHQDLLYSQDTHALNAWNAMMGDNARTVYRPEEHRTKQRWTKQDVALDAASVFIVLNNGNVVQFSSSEWTNIEKIGTVKLCATQTIDTGASDRAAQIRKLKEANHNG